MKVIFLDFDGVLNTEKGDWCPDCIGQLNRIIETTGAVIVVSSSWRLSWGTGALREHLMQVGVKGMMFDVTPCLSLISGNGVELSTARGVEILAYRRMHGIQTCVAIDDHTDGFMESITVQTTYAEGLTQEKADEAIRMLNA